MPDNPSEACPGRGVFTGVGGVVSSYLVDRLPLSADQPAVVAPGETLDILADLMTVL